MTDNVFWPLQRPEDIPKNQTNWPTFAPPQWQTFTPPLTAHIESNMIFKIEPSGYELNILSHQAMWLTPKY